jgi:hypothetical protein
MFNHEVHKVHEVKPKNFRVEKYLYFTGQEIGLEKFRNWKMPFLYFVPLVNFVVKRGVE